MTNVLRTVSVTFQTPVQPSGMKHATPGRISVTFPDSSVIVPAPQTK